MNRTAVPGHSLVLVGGGHAHVEVVRRLGSQPLPKARVTLVSPAPTTPYSGMLPGLVAGHYSVEETRVKLRPLCESAGVEFVQAPIHGLDLPRRQILFRDLPPLPFDTLSLNTGSTPALESIPGANRVGFPIKPVDRFLASWADQSHQIVDRAAAGQPTAVVVVGSGAGGVELLFALRWRLRALAAARPGTFDRISFHLVTSAEVPLADHGRAVQRLVARALEHQGIRIHAAHRVVGASDTSLLCANGRRIPFDALCWALHAAPPPWIDGTGLAVDSMGFIAVSPALQSVSHPDVFAAGDVAAVLEHPRPKSGVFAVRQGPPLAENLRRAALGRAPFPFRPRTRALNLITTGDRHAIASYGPWAMAGRWVWTWKDRIDRRWIRRYQRQPAAGDRSTPAPGSPAPNRGNPG
ncbi:MAG: FAD-dependent oxidoreductase [Limisphaerales bacterium]